MPNPDPARLLSDAAAVFDTHDLAKGVTWHPDGAVDLYGAVLLAAGANPDLLLCGSVDPGDVGVPAVRQVEVAMAYEALDALTGDLDAYNDRSSVTRDTAQALLTKAANLLAVRHRL